MDTTLLYQILESKEGIEHTSLELMESWLVQFPHNPVILKLIHKKKESLGIELDELDWNQMALSHPRMDDFFIQLDYDIKIPDRHIDMETIASEDVPEGGRESSDPEVNELLPPRDLQGQVDSPAVTGSAEEEPDSFIASNLEHFILRDGEDLREKEGTAFQQPELSRQNFYERDEETENWTDDGDDEEIIVYEMEDIDENADWTDEAATPAPDPNGSSAKVQLTDFTSWLRARNPNAEKNVEKFSEIYLLRERKKNKKKKSKKSKKKQQTAVKKTYNVKINKRLRSVIEFADQSLLDPKDIISETLAEILMEQGHYARAIDMYHRLSLAFPEKSVYFAQIIKKIQKK